MQRVDGKRTLGGAGTRGVVAVRLTVGMPSRRRIEWGCAVAVAAAAALPLTATARPEHGSVHATAAAVFVYGGTTGQDFPVVIETTRNGRKVTAARIAIRATCTSGNVATVPDGYQNMPVKRRKFSASFGPTTQRNDDGTTTDFQGSISGTFNKARTKVTGTWTFRATEHDGAGAVTDTCDSAKVTYSARR